MNSQARTYLRNFLADRNVASLAPSSQRAIERLCKTIRFSEASRFVEFGPGGGCFTAFLLDHMLPTARLTVFETNEKFVSGLRERFRDHVEAKQLEIVQGSAELVARLPEGSVDYIISGIPFSFLNEGVRQSLLESTARALRVGGSFLTYQVIVPPAAWDRILLTPMKERFEIARVEYELLNVPPLRLYEGIKRVATRM